jgi:PPM family protein phosphatase
LELKDMGHEIDAWARSETGFVRPINEDAFRVDLVGGYGAVADGMGGAAAGETASRLFMEAAAEAFQQARDRSEPQTLARVEAAYRLADQRIMEHIRRYPEHRGMGCTAELLAFSDSGYVLGHIGDSRCYRLRDRVLKQLTKDHSLVQKQLDAGIITADRARVHPLKHVILQAVGTGEPLALDLIRGRVAPGDQFLLCSDGLSNLVEDPAIERALESPATLEEKVDTLTEQALENGGLDNVTVVLMAVR